MGSWSENRKRAAALDTWRTELERRMARADSPIPMTAEEKADVAMALMAHANDKLPAAHPAKITHADARWLHDMGTQERAIADKLLRILPPLESGEI